MVDGHLGPIRFFIERLGNYNQPLAALSEIECIRAVIRSEPEGEEIVTVCQGGREPHPFAMTVLIEQLAKLLKNLPRGVDGISIQILSQHCQKYRL
jgi:hypothetical protein